MRALAIILGSALLGACTVSQEIASFHSAEWSRPETRDIRARVAVHQYSERLFSLQYRFGVPAHPDNGIYPRELQIFSTCLASRILSKHGFLRIAFGNPNPDDSYLNRSEIEMFILGLHEGEEPAHASGLKNWSWVTGPAVNEDGIASLCETALRPEFVWDGHPH